MLFEEGDNARTAFYDAGGDSYFGRTAFKIVSVKARTLDDAHALAETKIDEHVTTVGMLRVVDDQHDGWLIFGKVG